MKGTLRGWAESLLRLYSRGNPRWVNRDLERLQNALRAMSEKGWISLRSSSDGYQKPIREGSEDALIVINYWKYHRTREPISSLRPSEPSEPTKKNHKNDSSKEAQAPFVLSQILKEGSRKKRDWPAPKNKSDQVYDLIFENVWNSFPNKMGSKKKAYESWCKVGGREVVEIQRAIADGINREIEWRKRAEEHKARTDPRFFIPHWPHFATWLNQRRWEQELPSLPEEEILIPPWVKYGKKDI